MPIFCHAWLILLRIALPKPPKQILRHSMLNELWCKYSAKKTNIVTFDTAIKRASYLSSAAQCVALTIELAVDSFPPTRYIRLVMTLLADRVKYEWSLLDFHSIRSPGTPTKVGQNNAKRTQKNIHYLKKYTNSPTMLAHLPQAFFQIKSFYLTLQVCRSNSQKIRQHVLRYVCKILPQASSISILVSKRAMGTYH